MVRAVVEDGYTVVPRESMNICATDSNAKTVTLDKKMVVWMGIVFLTACPRRCFSFWVVVDRYGSNCF